jgi:hypothetical protein
MREDLRVVVFPDALGPVIMIFLLILIELQIGLSLMSEG